MNRKLPAFVLLAFSAVALSVSSCCGCHGNDEEVIHEEHGTDSLVEEVLVDTTRFVDTGGYVNDSLAMQNEIEEKYGVQWDFCDCVVKNDSIQKAFDEVLNAETTDDAQLDLIMARMDEVDMHCKTMLTQPNTTPEQRDKHERKVRKCLKEAGVR